MHNMHNECRVQLAMKLFTLQTREGLRKQVTEAICSGLKQYGGAKGPVPARFISTAPFSQRAEMPQGKGNEGSLDGQCWFVVPEQ